ncbi:MAG: short-chain dehydrogenase [Candidatus Muproteobacteria bacterium RIFCSPHIGHO2_12_FULL_60_33]|uniref:Short-chain dehydrogenase n=1 Tax=Candidatus Muproteobacteria bacterium RIFCSPLOWO2_01_FULL_60_18 TaxID=1817768 RepID=A0A1F6U0T0_9PROT|nr:MAG: short-chain dehydrogenase [Candidatus Muproteobacteria bacterium RIFCSPLOWO2_01_FULL_60_18]OGI51571.1 MAG: short-chain dehydrogenase [Candidatus Muproteobacteria bacterium RIFCSPHIGHO2_01_60_12]OGI55894.1 MAG: short-chain dehydrogenase [Candidatus Muproteobacteria bacterium RIFCSPHIGHO2_12_FULL_60_33]
MESKTVLITGCSSGIGNCLARGLRERGYRVFAGARKEADVAALSAAGFESLPLDLDSSGSIRAAVETVLDRTQGRLYALVNNGAYGQPGAVEDLSRETLRAQFETNLFGTQELTNLVIPAMRAQGEGRIIQMSSMLGIVCLAYRGAYNATKFALEALSDTMRLELRNTNIHVSIIEPGPITSRFRVNAYAAFKRHIDREHSVYREYYARVEKRLEGSKPLPFTLPPEAVLKKVIRALEARRPKARYAVTFPTYLFAVLRRVLPVRALDQILATVSNGGQR